jgi:hypothetical protein
MQQFVIGFAFLMMFALGCNQQSQEQEGPKEGTPAAPPQKAQAPQPTPKAQDPEGMKDTEKQPVELPTLEKWNATFVEKQFGAKLKSVKYETAGTVVYVTYLFEFTKDADDVKAVRSAFGFGPADSPILIYLFDAENVIVFKGLFRCLSGGSAERPEITGKKGDAFRVKNTFDRTSLEKATKLEFRPVEPK